MSRIILTVGFLLLSLSLYGAIEVGEKAPNLCWKDAGTQKVCLDDFGNTVRVLVYNAGF